MTDQQLRAMYEELLASGEVLENRMPREMSYLSWFIEGLVAYERHVDTLHLMPGRDCITMAYALREDPRSANFISFNWFCSGATIAEEYNKVSESMAKP